MIVLQYNPDSLSRSWQIQAAGGGESNRSEPLRIKGPPGETISIEAEIDVTDQLEAADAMAGELGIHPQLAVLETLIYPSSGKLRENNALAQSGTLEIIPVETLLPLFVWSSQRIVPVRITDFSVTEEAFDPNLNPLRAKVNIGMRVLSVDDLGFQHKGGGLFMTYLQNKEQLAAKVKSGTIGNLGIGGIP